MQKPPPPQVGFNNNVKHRGRVFHIQTEDSGVNHPHITTHLFVDGGRIIKSERSDYSDCLDQPNLPTLLRKRMKEQHKAMFVSLRRGRLDHLIDSAFSVESETVVEPAINGKSSAPPVGGAGSNHPARRSRPPVSFSRPRAPSSLLGIEEAETRKIADTPPSEDKATSDSQERAAARPALFDHRDPASLYGDAKISEQSLDDVILSYISDDLQAPPDKS